MSRHPREVLRAWRKAHRGAVDLDQITPHDPTAERHHRQLVVVLPHGAVWDEEYGAIARELGAGRVCHGARPDGSPSRWHEHAGHRSVEHWRLKRDHDNGDEPTLLLEDVVVDLVLQPVQTIALRTTDARLSDEWTEITRRMPITASLPDGAPPEAELQLEGGRVDRLQVALTRGDDWAEVPITDGVARWAMAAGRHNVRLRACGTGVVEDATLALGRLVLVERHRRYHRVSPAVGPE